MIITAKIMNPIKKLKILVAYIMDQAVALGVISAILFMR